MSPSFPSAVIFDMDGLLIDSEPLWRRAERLVFRRVGLELSDAQCAETMGLRIDEVVDYWYRRFPWKGSSLGKVASEVLEEVQRQIELHGEALPGASDIVRDFHRQGVPVALASSSPMELIDTVLSSLGLETFFDTRHSAMGELRGKPHPDVFLTTAKALKVSPGSCVVFEDSPVGVQAARSAGMMVVAVPARDQATHPVIQQADLCVDSLEAVTREMLRQSWRQFCRFPATSC